MRRLRLLLLVFFLVVFAVFMFTSIRDYVTSDYEAPVISSEGEILSLSVNDSEDLLLEGMTAQDNLDEHHRGGFQVQVHCQGYPERQLCRL